MHLLSNNALSQINISQSNTALVDESTPIKPNTNLCEQKDLTLEIVDAKHRLWSQVTEHVARRYQQTYQAELQVFNGWDEGGGDNTIEVHIHNLRKKLLGNPIKNLSYNFLNACAEYRRDNALNAGSLCVEEKVRCSDSFLKLLQYTDAHASI